MIIDMRESGKLCLAVLCGFGQWQLFFLMARCGGHQSEIYCLSNDSLDGILYGSGLPFASHTGFVKKYKEAQNSLAFADGTEIPLSSIFDLTGKIFQEHFDN